MTVIEIIFALAGISVLISYIFQDMLKLRIWAAVGAAIYIIGAIIAGMDREGMLVILIAVSLNLLINLYYIVRLTLDRKPILLPKDLKPIYNKTFSRLTPREFHELYLISKKEYKTDCEVIKENSIINSLYVILSGTAEVYQDFKKVTDLTFGSFLGEFSFITGNKTNATVVAKGDLIYLSWDKSTLEKLKITRTDLYIKLNNILGIELMRKLS